MDRRCLDHKFTLKANKFQAGLDKPHEHVIDLKVEMKFGRDVIKKNEFKTKGWVHLWKAGVAGEVAGYF